MTATVALVIVSFVAAIAVLAAVIFFADMMRADEACDAARAERDAALRAKAAQFEAWQTEATNLRADVAALEKENEESQRQIAELRLECRDATDLSIAFQREAERLNELSERFGREISYLRPIADAAEALASGPNSPGEWAALREALRARKEAQS